MATSAAQELIQDVDKQLHGSITIVGEWTRFFYYQYFFLSAVKKTYKAKNYTRFSLWPQNECGEAS
jgi:hypothetical protein